MPRSLTAKKIIITEFKISLILDDWTIETCEHVLTSVHLASGAYVTEFYQIYLLSIYAVDS